MSTSTQVYRLDYTFSRLYLCFSSAQIAMPILHEGSDAVGFHCILIASLALANVVGKHFVQLIAIPLTANVN